MEKTDQLVEFLLATMKETKDFVVGQAPDVAKEMLTYGLIDSWSWVFVSVILIGCGAWAWISALKVKNGKPMFRYAIGILGIVVGSCYLICSSLTIAKIEFAPKIYLIDQIVGCRSCKSK